MSNNLPALLPDVALPTGPAEIEGWEADEASNWLDSVVPTLRLVERAEDVRLAVGMVLWKLRQTTREGDYGRQAAALAESAGVGVSTLQRWRKLAEDHYEIGPPPAAVARSAGQTARRKAEKDVDDLSHPVRQVPAVIDTTAEQVPNADLLVDLEDERPPSTGRATKPQPAAVTFASDGDLIASKGPDADPLAWIVAQAPAALAERYDAATLRSASRRLLKAAEQTTTPSSNGACAHPKSSENKQTYGVFCGDCKARLR